MTRDVTTWSRLEPRPRNAEMVEGLRASVRDPLWLLSRQWQVGEFRGEDAGSPIAVDLTVEHDDLTRVDLRGAENDTAPFDYEDAPLEALVERERVMTDLPDGDSPSDVADRPAAEPPNRRLAAEAGQQFLRALDSNGYPDGGSPYAAPAFPEDVLLTGPDEPVAAEDRRYLRVMTGRVLDGAAVYRAIQEAVDNIDAVVDPDDSTSTWNVADANALPLPSAETSRTTAFEAGVEEFYRWYRDLYDEPTDGSGTAWDPTRMEYRFAVSTGADGDETVLEAEEYPGGSLDWHAFSPADGGDSLGATGDATTTVDEHLLPTSVRFPGMPAPRWWEFEDAAVSLDDIAADGLATPRLLMLEFATQYGNDWFQIPVETPVGTLSRVADLEVTDSFGLTDTARAVSDADGPDDPDWRLFSMDLPDHDEPGLFLPPTLTSSRESDPVERARLLRDEVANLAFGIEERIEGATGRPIERAEFTRPHVAIDTVKPADDHHREYVELANPGDDDIDVTGFAVRREDGTTVIGDLGAAVTDGTLAAGERVRLYTGVAGLLGFDPPAVRIDPGTDVTFEWVSDGHELDVADQPDGVDWTGTDGPEDEGYTTTRTFDTEGTYLFSCGTHHQSGTKGAIVVGDGPPDFGSWFDDVDNYDGTIDERGRSAVGIDVGAKDADTSDLSAGATSSMWTDADAVEVATGGDIVAKRLLNRVPETLADYRLSTDIPDHWFPFTMEVDPTNGAHRLVRSLLLDADTLGLALDAIPRPVGEILDPDTDELPAAEANLQVYEEEVTKSGLTVSRRYQLAAWTDGSTHLWSTRRARVGRSDESSGLRFDVLEEHDGGE